jgi:apolipoprotein N-acyltransferase
MLFSVVCALLLIFAFPNFNQSYLVFIGFIPLFFSIQNRPPKKAFLIAYLCGFLFYLGVLYWLYHVTVFGLIALCLYLALYFGIFGFLFTAIANHRSRFIIILVPLIWIVLEYIQSRIFSGFGWALLGYSQYKNLPLIQIADLFGVYGVSFIIMLVNVAIYRFFKRSLREIIITAVVLMMVIGYGILRLNEGGAKDSIKVSIVQGNIPQDIKWNPDLAEDILERYSLLTQMAALDGSDLIVWPETSFPGFLVSDKELTRKVLDLVKGIKIPLLLGANTEKTLESFNSAVLVSEKGEILDRYDKIHLVPFGEFVPFSDRFPSLHDLVLGELGEFTAGDTFSLFEARPRTAVRTVRGIVRGRASNIRFSVLICFEDIFPELARTFVREGAEFLIVITNDAWYKRSGAPYQHAACSVFRAIENRVSVVRCANTGYSCFIDSRGRIYDSVEEDGIHLFITGYKSSEVPL